MSTDYMYNMKCSQDGNFYKGELQRFGNIELSPASGILNYGQVCFALAVVFSYILNILLMLFILMITAPCFFCHTLLKMLLEILIGIV